MTGRALLLCFILASGLSFSTIACADEAEDLFSRAVEAENSGDLDQALELFNRIAEMDPENAAVYNNRGVVNSRIKRYDAAIEDFTRALDIDPERAGTYNNRGMAYQDKGEIDRAMSDYDKALSIDPSYLPALFSRVGLGQKQRELAQGANKT